MQTLKTIKICRQSHSLQRANAVKVVQERGPHRLSIAVLTHIKYNNISVGLLLLIFYNLTDSHSTKKNEMKFTKQQQQPQQYNPQNLIIGDKSMREKYRHILNYRDDQIENFTVYEFFLPFST